jgi:hypothetical protein
MTGEASSYFICLVLLSAAIIMNAVGLAQKRKAMARYRGEGEIMMEGVARGQFNGQFAGFVIIVAAALVCLWRLVDALHLSMHASLGAILTGQVLVSGALLATFVLQMQVMLDQRRLLLDPFYRSGPRRALLAKVHRGTIGVTVLTGVATVTVVVLALMMQAR